MKSLHKNQCISLQWVPDHASVHQLECYSAVGDSPPCCSLSCDSGPYIVSNISFCLRRQQHLMAFGGQASAVVDIDTQLKVPSLQEVVRSLKQRSVEQLQGLLCEGPAKSAHILEPLVECPTLVQVGFAYLALGGLSRLASSQPAVDSKASQHNLDDISLARKCSALLLPLLHHKGKSCTRASMYGNCSRL